MVFVLIALWTIAAILLLTNPKRESTRWAALTAFTGGGGGLSRTMTETVIPYLHHFQISTPTMDTFFFKLHIAGSFMNHTGLPYCFLMYAVCYSGFFKDKTRKTLAWILPIPIIVMLFITPFSPDIHLNFEILFFWCVPYLMIGLFLLMYSYSKERNARVKKSRVFSNLVAIPPILFQIFFNYTFKAFFQFNEVWRYMPLTITVLLVSFVIFGTKYGVLGVKLKFEKDRLDSTMKAMTSGTTILNHTIKNEIGMISILADRIKYIAAANEQVEINKHVDTVIESTEHMLGMVSRIQSQLQDIELKEKSDGLGEIIDASLLLVQPFIENQHIQVIQNTNCHVELLCDKVHLQEVFNNLFKNAIEAMSPGGKLYVSINETKKHIAVEIKDNGIGIAPDDLSRVIDPFFSTKNRSLNFGLGLSYCYNVMQKHGGSLEIHSEKSIGTTVALYFPHKRVILVNMSQLEEAGYEQNQSATG